MTFRISQLYSATEVAKQIAAAVTKSYNEMNEDLQFYFSEQALQLNQIRMQMPISRTPGKSCKNNRLL